MVDTPHFQVLIIYSYAHIISIIALGGNPYLTPLSLLHLETTPIPYLRTMSGAGTQF